MNGGWEEMDDDGWSGSFLQIDSVSSVSFADTEIDIVMEDPRLLDFSDEGSDEEEQKTSINCDKPTSNPASKSADYEAIGQGADGREIWKCKTCPYESPLLRGMIRHCQAAHSGGRYQCRKCPAKFSSGQHVAAHYRRCHPRYPSIKPQTPSVLPIQKTALATENLPITTPASSNASRNSTPSATVLKCQDCSFHARTRKLMAKHQKTAHKTIKTYTCKHCPSTSFTTCQKLAAHCHVKHSARSAAKLLSNSTILSEADGISSISSLPPSASTTNSSDVTSPKKLSQDVKLYSMRTTRKSGLLYFCNSCEFSVKTLEDIELHCRDHVQAKSSVTASPVTIGPVQRSEMQQLLKAPPMKRRRENGRFSKTAKDTFTETFTEESNVEVEDLSNPQPDSPSHEDEDILEQSLETFVPEMESPPPPTQYKTLYKCHFCGLKITSKPRFETHILSSHGKDNPFPCRLCDNFRFASNRALRIHYEKYHTKADIAKAISKETRSSKDNKDKGTVRSKFAENGSAQASSQDDANESKVNEVDQTAGSDDIITLSPTYKSFPETGRKDRAGIRDFMRFSCLRCFKHFNTSIELSIHYKKCEGTMESFPCSSCLTSEESLAPSSFTTLRNLKSHIWQEHVSATEKLKILKERKDNLEKGTDSYPYNCLLCKHQLPDKKSFVLHISTPHMYSCKQCKFVTSIKSNLREHTLAEHSNKEEEVEILTEGTGVCPQPTEESTTAAEIPTGAETAEEADSYESLICVLCGNVSKTVEEAKEHTKMIEIESLICDTCGFVGTSPCELLLHLKTHIKDEEESKVESSIENEIPIAIDGAVLEGTEGMEIGESEEIILHWPSQ